MIVLEESAQTKYMQIYRQIRESIIDSGRLPAGSKLPSSRALAEALHVSRNTVCLAYEQLYAEGYLERKARQGFYVSEFDLSQLRERQTTGRKEQPPLVAEEEPCRYDFRPRRVDVADFPFPLWNKLLCRAVNDYQQRFFYYGHPQGELSLRIRIAEFLNWRRGIVCQPEQIILSDGTQQSLNLICQLLRGQIRKAAIEEPGNCSARFVFQNCGLPVAPIPVETDGISVEALDESGADAVYVTPSRQFPSGVVMSVNKRAQLLEWAERHKSVIIEDDFNCYYRFNLRPVPALFGLGYSDRVIYLGSFAQAVFPAVRLSYIVLPPPILESYLRMYQGYDSPVAALLQKTMELFMEGGHFEHHLRKMNQIYKKKHDILYKALCDKMGDRLTIESSNAGLHLLITVNSGLSEAELIEKAASYDVKIGSIAKHWINPPKTKNARILLSFGAIDQNDIIPAVDRLRQAWADIPAQCSRTALPDNFLAP